LIVSSIIWFTCYSQGGTYLFQIIDYYTSTWSVIYIAFFEVIAVSWMYGGNKMAADIERITGTKPLWFFKFCWYITTPLSLMVNLYLNNYHIVWYSMKYIPLKSPQIYNSLHEIKSIILNLSVSYNTPKLKRRFIYNIIT